ncbi:MAG: hypothetical protein HYY06_01525 [Deltaproteobacteria bacterium]|nr:hypothetical protein [Deltaproteobacteria bacterium]
MSALAKTFENLGVAEPERWLEEHADLVAAVVLAESSDPALERSPVGADLLKRLRRGVGDVALHGRELREWNEVMRSAIARSAEKRAADAKERAATLATQRLKALEQGAAALATLQAELGAVQGRR